MSEVFLADAVAAVAAWSGLDSVSLVLLLVSCVHCHHDLALDHGGKVELSAEDAGEYSLLGVESQSILALLILDHFVEENETRDLTNLVLSATTGDDCNSTIFKNDA